MEQTVLWQKAEGAVIFIAGVTLFSLVSAELSWWLAVLAFFAPDLSFASYLLGPKIGAAIYNLVHIYAFGTVFIVLGTALSAPVLAALGALWLAHSGLDRLLGYGLKSPQGFSFTHLGRIGKQSRE
ncbi:DUF4260 domain-containing protein [Devosia sp. YIM 151766]|uniref:DUF4260 domain-containing protein n=1 Tax=Devosia sp. YIM 151766 TaxID=3017325 RepID=UPI00255C6670|nr:DUF4260 domain-containing protein [Devosia sp. YIM 151766]WIY52250.1 DUF4260 domain-containing protein [Devosia sp. YIM 151766]